ncbi:hypothetical protein HUG20_04845 [Salicibibacter cibi]|uniref:Uncharacterized protein n=1 Tax=Salicibibacter cibi TaxID=2743001 RepID=A0A7T6Z9F2_9BACI|nr:hypothetical protein HUG20_04845 [Salicibibacter cibi]
MSYPFGERRGSYGVSWAITLVVFILVQLFFIAIDGTALEPTRFNDSGDIGGRIVQSELFTERITPYSNPSLNIATI